MRAWLLPSLLIHFSATVAQEQYGLVHGNYAGMDAATLNPARAAGQWPWMDIRIAGTDVHAWNSLVAWTARRNPLITEARTGFTGLGDGRVVMRSLDFDQRHRATVLADVVGPGVSLSLGRGTIGAGIRGRAHVSAAGISTPLGNFILNGLNHAPQHGIRYNEAGLRVLGAAWTEVGMHYAHILHAREFSLFSAGIGLRYLIGHSAAAFQVTDMNYTVQDSARLDVHAFTARYGYAAPEVNAGRGFGGDLGFVYERTLDPIDGYRPHRPGSCEPARYRYRIGVSLIDLGGIGFRRAQAGTVAAGELSIADYDDTDVDGVEGVDSLLATSTNRAPITGMRMGLPTAISIQYDQRITDFAYVGLAAVQHLAGRNSMRLRRANSVAITPRFETRYVELAFPVVVPEYDIRRPLIGAMVRLHGLTVGSDHILPFISRRDMHAMDLYVRLRWMIFRSPACRNGRSRAIIHRGGVKDALPCLLPES